MDAMCVVQARMGSSRLPGKVLADVAGSPMLVFMLERLRALDRCHLVVATSDTARDDPVEDAARGVGVQVVRGPEDDVLGRFGVVLAASPAEIVVRLTADCPLTDPELVRATIDLLDDARADYASNTLVRTFPDGLDVEAFRADALRAALAEARDLIEREHVTPFIYRRPERFRLVALRNNEPLGDERWTVDSADDLEFARRAVSLLDGRRDFSWRDVLGAVGRRAEPAANELHLRPGFPSDEGLLLALRNETDAVTFSGSGRPVSRAEHRRWFRSRLTDPSTRIWVGEVGGVPVGQIRVDVEAAVGTVSLAVDPAHRGKGHGVRMIRSAQRMLLADHQIKVLEARVHRENRVSKRAFERAGFAPGTGARAEFEILRWDRDEIT
ncbi:MAG: GNAT family N-acetyltransferase [Microthrixaceae bacterium]